MHRARPRRARPVPPAVSAQPPTARVRSRAQAAASLARFSGSSITRRLTNGSVERLEATYAGLTTGQGVAAGLSGDRDTRADLGVGAATSFLGVVGVSVSGGGNDNSGYGGAGVGIKIPFADRRLATRMEANYAHGFSSGGSNQIGLTLGLSFFTR